MKKTITLLLLIAACIPAYANIIKMNLSEAIKIHMVQAEAWGTGQSYKAKGLRIKLANKSGSTIQLKIDQAVIFKPADASYQPLVCAGEEMITLQPFKDGQLEVQTFCGDAGESAPQKDLVYSYSHKGSDTLQKALQYIKKNVLFDELGQKAVWVITNHHSLQEVYDPARDMQSNKLVEYMAMITGQLKPAHYIGTAISEVPGAPVYTPKPLRIFAKFEQVLEEPKKLTLGVYNAQGNMVQEVFSDRMFGRTGHRFSVTFESSDVPAGKYYIRLKEGSTVLQEKMVEVQ